MLYNMQFAFSSICTTKLVNGILKSHLEKGFTYIGLAQGILRSTFSHMLSLWKTPVSCASEAKGEDNGS